MHKSNVSLINHSVFLCRYAATGVANLATYAIAWVILSSGGGSVGTDALSHADADHFRVNLTHWLAGIGAVVVHFEREREREREIVVCWLLNVPATC